MKLTIIIIVIQLDLLINSGFAYNDVCHRMKFIRIKNQYEAQGIIAGELSWTATLNNFIKFTSSGQQLKNDRISENLCKCILFKLQQDHPVTYAKMNTDSIKIDIKLQYQHYNDTPLTVCKPKYAESEHKPVKEEPVEEKRAEENSAKENPNEETPVEEKSFEEQVTEERPVEEKSFEKQATEERPVEKKATEDKLLEEGATEEKPVEGKPEKAVERNLIEEIFPEQKAVREIPPEEKPIEYMILKGNKSKVFLKNIYDIYLIHKNTAKNEYEYIIDGILQNVKIDDFKK